MKRKLQEIIQEKFNYEETCLLLPDMDLRFSAVENEVFEGTFLFHSSSAQEVRGIVTCENPHVICETREFHGTVTYLPATKQVGIRIPVRIPHLRKVAAE